MRRSQLFIGLSFLSAAMVIGCNRADTDENARRASAGGAAVAVGTSGATSGAAQYPTDDASVTTGIQAKFFRDSSLKTRHIDVTTQSGIVTLRGTVANDNERAQARLLAWTTHGVQRVDDVLAVDSTIASRAQVDAALETAVRDHLQGTSGMTVTAKDGVVLLDGVVPTAAAKQHVMAAAQQTDGVVQVVDRVVVEAVR